MKKVYTVLIGCVFLINSYAQKKLVVIGSSTSACFGFSGPGDPNCYINQLMAHYLGAGQSVTLTNLAVSGTNVYQGMPTGYPPIISGSQSFSPNPAQNISAAINAPLSADVVIVNYPTNEYQNMTITQVMLYLRTIRKFANDAGKPCFITTSQPRNNFDAITRLRLKEIRDSVIDQFGIYALNFWDGIANPDGTIIPAMGQGDGVHINTTGHTLFFQRVRDANILAASLPVRLSSFAAKKSKNNIRITWTTEDETPGTIYNLQRSVDGRQFHNLHTVTAPVNSRGRNAYEFTDRSALTGNHYYRIEMIENAKTSFSRTEKVFATNAVAATIIIAEGSQTRLSILSIEKQKIQLRILSASGQQIVSTPKNLEPGQNNFRVQHTLLSKGIYWLEVSKGNERLMVQSYFVD